MFPQRWAASRSVEICLSIVAVGRWRLLVASVACEAFEYAARYRAKLSDIFINMAGYAVGSLLYRHHGLRLRPTPTLSVLCALAAVVAAMLGALYAHRRQTMHRLGDISTKEDFVALQRT